jgi:hypothetical protein
MENILNNLLPEVREMLDADKATYPSLYKRVIGEMKQAYLVTDLSVSTASILIGYAEQLKVKFDNDNFVLKLYRIFEIKK